MVHGVPWPGKDRCYDCMGEHLGPASARYGQRACAAHVCYFVDLVAEGIASAEVRPVVWHDTLPDLTVSADHIEWMAHLHADLDLCINSM